MALIVVESPTKARTFNRILKMKEWDKDYFVFATVGHFRDLPAKNIAVDFKDHFAPEYEIIEKKMKMVEKLKELAKEHGEVILATDPDREGESISYHVAYVLGMVDEKWPDFEIKNRATLKRIIFHEITPKALEEALQNPEHLREDLVKAQQARRILDRIVGYQLSPLLWKKMNKNWLSAGRVQTVALRLIVEREKEITAFSQDPYHQVFANFKSEVDIRAQLISKNGEKYEVKEKLSLFDGEYEFSKTTIDKAAADVIKTDLESDTFNISTVTEEVVKRYPPPPYTTSLLQQDAFQKLNFPSRLTMRIAQSLYEKGLITYHRTDSFNLSAKYVFGVKDYIVKKYGEEYALEKPRGFKTKSKNAQEAHEAIRPTQPGRALKLIEGKKMTDQEKKLYELIFNRALSTQMKEAEVKQLKVQITSGKGYEFETIYSQVLFDGFMKVLMPAYAEKNKVAVSINQKSTLALDSIELEEKLTRPPYRYNEGSLIRALEEKGIGRPSTYSSIISLIIDKHYVEKDRRYLKPGLLGTAISDYLSGAFPDIFGLTFTAEMEDSLDDIANGDKKLLDLLETFYTPFSKEVTKEKGMKNTIDVAEDVLEEPCPQCGSQLIARFGKYGKFYACRDYPNCKYIKPNLHFVKDHFCPLCKGRLVSCFSKKGKRFYGCENYPTCKHVQWALNVPTAKPSIAAPQTTTPEATVADEKKEVKPKAKKTIKKKPAAKAV